MKNYQEIINFSLRLAEEGKTKSRKTCIEIFLTIFSNIEDYAQQ